MPRNEWAKVADASRCSLNCACSPQAHPMRDAFRARAWGVLLEAKSLTSPAALAAECGLPASHDILRRYVSALIHIGDVEGLQDFAAAAGGASGVDEFWQAKTEARHAQEAAQQAPQFFKCVRLFDLLVAHNARHRTDFDMAHLAVARGRELAGFERSITAPPVRMATVLKRVRGRLTAGQLANETGPVRFANWPDAAAIFLCAPCAIAFPLWRLIQEGRTWQDALLEIESDVPRGPRPKRLAQSVLRNLVNDHVHLAGAASWTNANGMSGPTVGFLDVALGIWGIPTDKIGAAESTIREALQRHARKRMENFPD